MQRPAPNAPPAYARYLPARFASHSSLRPAVLLVAFFSAIYGMCAGAAVIRRRNTSDTSATVDTVYLALAVLYFTAAAIEVFGIGAAYKQTISLVRYYFWGSASVALIVTAAEVTRVVVHFTDKTAIQAACLKGEQEDQIGNRIILSDDYCSSIWRSASYWDVGMLVVSLLLSIFFASLVASYLQQLLNPALLRQRTAHIAPSSQYNYPLQPYPPNPYGQPQQQQPYDQGFVPPPYNPAGGPPGYGGNELPFDPPKEKDPFADGAGMTSEQREQQQHEEEMRRRAMESSESIDLTPRRENEGRV